jgi:hypothetical protein
MMQRISVDFNTIDSEPLDLVKIYRDTPIDLHDGKRVLLYDEEMEVEAIAIYDADHHIWLAAPDWTTRHDFANRK